MKGWKTSLFQTKEAAASRMSREIPVLLTVPCRVIASPAIARGSPRNVVSLSAGLPVLNMACDLPSQRDYTAPFP